MLVQKLQTKLNNICELYVKRWILFGVLTIETFETTIIYVGNEIAPRVHHSWHGL
jgi:phosphoribosylaminoimidazole carboxylase (NCAIR synthetase)